MLSLLLLGTLLLNHCCQVQSEESIVDDEQAWNTFFRGLHTAPQFPYPGTLGHAEWDEYSTGFPPSLWETKDFLTIIRTKRNPTSNTISPYYMWEGFWKQFDLTVELENRAAWENIDSERLWKSYINTVKEIFCCTESDNQITSFGYGCTNLRDVNDCCKMEKMFSSCKNSSTSIIKDWGHFSIQAMKFKFYYWLCVVYADRLKMEKLDVCPNPCRYSPCEETANAIPSTCVPMPFPRQVYRNEYTCQCRPNYFFDPYTRLCLPKPLCSRNPCNSAGTARCVDLEHGFECQCKPEFAGSLCSSLSNPCLRRWHPTDISGNVACATSLGNRCEAHYGKDSFRCLCFPPYRREGDPQKLAAAFRRTLNVDSQGNNSSSSSSSSSNTGESLPPDNCMAKLDACSRVSCGEAEGRGRCMPSGNLLSFVCVCTKNPDGYPMFEGEHCEIAVSQWLDWSHWGRCRPECGASCFQSRERPCGHLDGYSYCKGTEEELRPCEPACPPCPNRSFAHLSGVFVKETAKPLLLAIVSLFLLQLLCVATLDWFFSPDRTQPV